MPAYSMPRPNSPISGPDGYISREWYMFLSSVFQSVGGPLVATGGGIPPIDVQKQFEEYPLTPPEGADAQRAVDELRNSTDRDQSPLLRELVAAVDDLKNNQDRDQSGLLREAIAAIDELRNELALSRNDAQTLRNRIELIEDRLA